MIKNILKKFFPKTILEIEEKAKFHENKRISTERNEDYLKSKMFEVTRLVDKPVIILTNEWQNPVIGKIISVKADGNRVDYKVLDYLTNEVSTSSNTLIPYTYQKLKIFGKITPDEICALFFEGRYSSKEIRKNRDSKYLENKRTNIEDWLEKLEKNGFFNDFPDEKIVIENDKILNVKKPKI